MCGQNDDPSTIDLKPGAPTYEDSFSMDREVSCSICVAAGFPDHTEWSIHHLNLVTSAEWIAAHKINSCDSPHSDATHRPCADCGWVFIGPLEMPEHAHGVCQYCGKNYGSTHSGTIECGSCWDWRKIGRGAAMYWLEAVDRLYVDPEGGNIDMADYDQWRRWNMRDEVNSALETMVKLHDTHMEEMFKHNALFHECVFKKWEAHTEKVRDQRIKAEEASKKYREEYEAKYASH